MKLCGLVVVAALAGYSDAFGVSSVNQRSITSAAATVSRKAFVPHVKTIRPSSLLMLVPASGGMMELEELVESDTGMTKTIRKSPKLWKIASYAAIPVSAAIGYGAVQKVAAPILTGMVGFIGRSKMTDVSGSAAKPAIASLLMEVGIEDPSQLRSQLALLRSEYSVHRQDFSAACADVYRKYLVGMVKFDSKPKSSELTELENLKNALDLDNLEVGEAHMLAAQDWYRETCLFITDEELDDEDSPERMAMNKMLYLTERALRQNGESDGAFLYEMTRTSKVFNLTYAEALERVEEVVEPFYERALKSARSKLGSNQVSAAMLERARRTLGVDDRMGFDLHEAALNDEVRSLLGDSAEGSNKFPEGTEERLEQLRDILSLAPEDVEYETTSEAMPLFRATALEAMKGVVDETMSADEAWKIMDSRRDELLIPASKSDELVSTVVVNALGAPLEEVKKYADVNNEGSAYDSMLELIRAKNAVVQVLEKAGWKDDFYDSFCNPVRRFSINGQLDSQERSKLYDIFVRRTLKTSKDDKMTDEQDALVKEIKGILFIDDVVAESQASREFGPKLYAAMEKSMLEIIDDYAPKLLETCKTEIDQIVEDYKISDRMIAQNGRNLYGQALKLVSAKAPAGIPTPEQNEALKGLQGLFRIDDRESTPMHLTTFGPVYQKSLEEAMAVTGVIRAEYRKPLEDLRERLGVSEAQARELFLSAVKQRMIPMLEWIGSEMESIVLTKQQLAQRRDKDMGEDYFQSGKQADGTLGLGAETNVLGDIMNLVDFYTENDIAEERKDGSKTETIYPITALETGVVEQEMAELLYRQFVVGSFTTQGPNAARYENSRETFGGILGLDAKKMTEIGSTIAETVYDNYVGQSMRTKGALDQQDMMFLANLQTKLGLTSEQGENFMMTAQKKIMNEEIDAIMLNSPTPEAVKMFREKCNSMGLNMERDVGISKGRLTRMFEMEISPGLESGEIAIDNADVLGEIQESIGFEPAEAEKAFERLVMSKSNRDFERVAKDVRRGRTTDIVEPLNRLVRFGAFLGGDLGIEVEEKVGRQIYNAYENFDFSDVTPEQAEEKKTMLKAILALS